MQCKHCGSQLSEGVAFCQQCGTPVPPPPSSIAPTVAAFPPSYNNPSADANYNSSSLPPTVAATPSSYNPPGSGANYNPSSIPPTVAAPSPSYGNPPGPYTNYNPSSLPGSGNQGFEVAQNPYANAPYSQPPSGNVAPPPPSNVPSYDMPFQGNNMAYSTGVPPFAAAPAKPKSKVGLIIGIVIAVLLVACVGSTILVTSLAHTASQANTPAATPTPSVPSGKAIDPTAASIVTNIQMASAVDTISAKPTKLTKSFKTYSTIYSTFDLNFSGTSVSSQNPGYVEAKFYLGRTLVSSSDPLSIDDATVPGGYFSAEYYRTTTAGTVELYWCKVSSCSDAALAGIATFTVTS